MTTARERMVRVVTETLTRHRTATFGMVSPGSGWTCKCGEGGTVPMHSSAFAAHERHATEAVVAALEAQMGLRVERGQSGSVAQGAQRLVTDWQEDGE